MLPLLPIELLLLTFNLALASGICTVVGIVASYCFRSLAKQHAMLVAGLLGTLLAPLAVGLAWRFELGQLDSARMTASETIASHSNNLMVSADDNRLRAGDQEILSDEQISVEQSRTDPRLSEVLTPSNMTANNRVVDERGAAVPEAELRAQIYYKTRPDDPKELGVGQRVTTDEQGNWSIENVPMRLESVTLEINHPSYKPTYTTISTMLFSQNEEQAFTQSIVLQNGLVVRGRVLDTDGKPLEGAVVRSKFSNSLREAVSRTDGSYELIGCDAGLATITAAANGKALTRQKLQIHEKMEPVDFTMHPGGFIRVRVLDRDGQPVPKTRMFFQRWNGEQVKYFEFDHINSYTDEQGIWEWNEAPLEELHVDICPPGGTSLSEQPIRARAEEYLFETPPLLRLVGKVIDAETRQPIEEFQVVPGVRGSPERMNWVPSQTFEGANGEFEYTETHSYLAHLVKVQAKGYATIVSREIASDEGTVKLLFELQPAAGINMRVMTPDGLPAVGAKVALGVKGSQINVYNGDIDDGSTYAERTTVNAAGRFRFSHQTTRYQLPSATFRYREYSSLAMGIR